jgi:hypothetical protein
MTRNAEPQHRLEGGMRFDTISNDQAVLEANAKFDEPPRENVRRAVCYNQRCPDYRVERPADKACGCRRTSVT